MKERKIKQKEDRQIKFRVTEDRHQYLSIMAQQTGMSLAQFAKNATFGIEYRPPKIETEIASQLLEELRRQGVNLNQIAKWCNSSPSVYKNDLEEIKTLIIELKDKWGELWEQF